MGARKILKPSWHSAEGRIRVDIGGFDRFGLKTRGGHASRGVQEGLMVWVSKPSVAMSDLGPRDTSRGTVLCEI